MARVLGVSASGYYAYLNRGKCKRSEANEKLIPFIAESFKSSRETYGSPRIHAELKASGHICSLNRVARLMSQQALYPKKRRKFKITTDSKHHFPIAKNLLRQNFLTAAPNLVWVSDITFIWTQEGWLYLAVTLDLFSRKVVGMAMSANIDRHLVIKALQQAITRRDVRKGLIHHSDRGVQYASNDFQIALAQHHLLCSMSGRGNCYDNAAMESFFHTLKTEWVYKITYHTREEAIASIFEFVEVFYNNQRRHSTLGYLSPNAFELVKGVSL